MAFIHQAQYTDKWTHFFPSVHLQTCFLPCSLNSGRRFVLHLAQSSSLLALTDFPLYFLSKDQSPVGSVLEMVYSPVIPLVQTLFQPALWLFVIPWTVAHRVPLSAHGIFQARIQEWVAIFYFRGFSQPRDWTCISCISCTSRWILYPLVPPGKPTLLITPLNHLPVLAPVHFLQWSQRDFFQKPNFMQNSDRFNENKWF